MDTAKTKERLRKYLRIIPDILLLLLLKLIEFLLDGMDDQEAPE
jgi:hypothetical protein